MVYHGRIVVGAPVAPDSRARGHPIAVQIDDWSFLYRGDAVDRFPATVLGTS